MPDNTPTGARSRATSRPWSRAASNCSGVEGPAPPSGKPLVEISLQTGDDATARMRWAQIHPQVEALVQIARVRANGAGAPRQAPVQVDRLTRDQISIMGAQAHHDILAKHDRGWIDPSFSSPLTAITTKLMLAKGAAMSQRTAEDARRQAQAILERQARSRCLWMESIQRHERDRFQDDRA